MAGEYVEFYAGGAWDPRLWSILPPGAFNLPGQSAICNICGTLVALDLPTTQPNGTMIMARLVHASSHGIQS